MQIDDREIIKTLMEELSLSLDKASGYLARYDRMNSGTE